jgi:hypothetical protein
MTEYISDIVEGKCPFMSDPSRKEEECRKPFKSGFVPCIRERCKLYVPEARIPFYVIAEPGKEKQEIPERARIIPAHCGAVVGRG